MDTFVVSIRLLFLGYNANVFQRGTPTRKLYLFRLPLLSASRALPIFPHKLSPNHKRGNKDTQ